MTSVVKSGKLSNNAYALIGAGHMGGALLRGWLRAGDGRTIQAHNILVIDPAPGEAAKRALTHGVKFSARLTKGAASGLKMCLLAIKPQNFAEVGQQLAKVLPMDCLVISIMAGINLQRLSNVFGRRPIVRAMPNLPAAYGAGMTAYVCGSYVSKAQISLVEEGLAAGGKVVRVTSEDEIDMVTALSGSGPAYHFYMTEVMAEIGQKLGLSSELAKALARQTAVGAGVVLEKSSRPVSELRKSVTSPGGTTEAALKILKQEGGLTDLMSKAMHAAYKRSQDLGKEQA